MHLRWQNRPRFEAPRLAGQRSVAVHERTADMWAIQYVQWRIASGKRSSAGYGVSTPTSGESIRVSQMVITISCHDMPP